MSRVSRHMHTHTRTHSHTQRNELVQTETCRTEQVRWSEPFRTRPSNRTVTVRVSTQRPAARAVDQRPHGAPGTVPPASGPRAAPHPLGARVAGTASSETGPHTRRATHPRRASSASAHPRPRWRSWKENRPGQSLRARGSPTWHGPEGKHSSAFKSEAVGEARGRHDTETFPTGSDTGALPTERVGVVAPMSDAA